MNKTNLKTKLITIGTILLVDIAVAAAMCYWDGEFIFLFVLPPLMLISLLIVLVSMARKHKFGAWMWLSNILIGPFLSFLLGACFMSAYISYISKKMPVEMAEFYEANKDRLWTTAHYFSSIMGDSIYYCDIQKCDDGYQLRYESAHCKKELVANPFDSLKSSLSRLGHDPLRIDTLQSMMLELGSENICYRHQSDTISSMSNGVALSYRYKLHGYYGFAFRDKEIVCRDRKLEFMSPNNASSITYNDSVLFYHTPSLFGFEDFPGKKRK